MQTKINLYSAGGRSTHLVFKSEGDVIVGNHDGGFLHPTAPWSQGAQI